MAAFGMLLLGLLGFIQAASGTPQSLIDEARLPLSTRGRFIVDKHGLRVKLACVNWYGAHMELHTVGGLQVQHIQNISDRIAALGFNCVRLPFSLEMVKLDSPVHPWAVAANPQLVGLNSMAVLDATVGALNRSGLLIVMNNHNSKPGWCCDLDSEEGLWATSAYSATTWLEVLGTVATRYVGVPRVVGMDLRNEIHDARGVGKVVTWGASASIDTDWKVATEAAAVVLHAAAPSLLVVVSGLCFSFDIRKLHDAQPAMPDPSRLVWTVHFYSFSRWWTRVEDRLQIKWTDINVATCAMLGLVLPGLAACLWACRATPRRYEAWRDACSVSLALGLWLGMLSAGLWVGAYAAQAGYDAAGCEVMNVEGEAFDLSRDHTTWLACVFFVLAIGMALVHERTTSRLALRRDRQVHGAKAVGREGRVRGERVGSARETWSVFGLP